MKPLSEATRDLFNRFNESLGGRLPRLTEQEKAEQLCQIGESREPAAVPSLLGMLYTGDPQVANMAAVTIQRIVEACNLPTLAQLDPRVREMSGRLSRAINSSDVVPLARGLTGTVGVLSFHRSGYLREPAVRALGEAQDGQELPFLLIRLNDWVPAVRDTARHAIVQRIRPDYAAHFVRCLPLLDRLRQQRREDHGPLLGAVLNLLRATGSRPALHEALLKADRQTRRLAFRLLAEGSHEDSLLVLSEALGLDDTVIRLWAAQELRKRLEDQPLRDMLERMKGDRFMPVRREALYGSIEKLPEAAASQIRALLDPHVSMREAARYYLPHSHVTDVAAFYRARIADAEGERLAAAVAGLGETGRAEDALRLTPFLLHPASRVRRAAVAGIGRLDAHRFIEQILAALRDEAAGVSAAARNVLLPRLYLVQPERLWAIFQATDMPHVRRVLLSLVAGLGWWDSARLLVDAAGWPDEATRQLALQHLERWRRNCHRLSVRPGREQLGLLEAAVRRHRDRLDEASASDLHSLVSYARRELI